MADDPNQTTPPEPKPEGQKVPEEIPQPKVEEETKTAEPVAETPPPEIPPSETQPKSEQKIEPPKEEIPPQPAQVPESPPISEEKPKEKEPESPKPQQEEQKPEPEIKKEEPRPKEEKAPEVPKVNIEEEVKLKLDEKVNELLKKANEARKQRKEENLNQILELAKKKEIDNQDARDLLQVSQSSASSYLSELIKSGKLKSEGKGKARIYKAQT